MNNRLRQSYLSTMGVQCWQLKSAPELNDENASNFNDVNLNSAKPSRDKKDSILPVEMDNNAFPVADVSENPLQVTSSTETLKQNDVQAAVSEPVLQTIKNELQHSEPDHVRVEANTDNHSELTQAILDCRLCPDRTTRQNALPGQGSDNASIFIISDSPNADEDRVGHYLTGQNETLFKAMLNAVDLTSDYFLTGLVKCFSMEQFLLSEEDIEHCSSFLHQQLSQVNPSVVVIFGVAQAQSLLKSRDSFAQLRGKIHRLVINQVEYPVIVTYHPAFLIRNPLFKKEALADLIRIKSLVK